MKNVMIYMNYFKAAIQDDDGRRYYIVDISTEKTDDKAYWTDLHDNILLKEVGAAVYSYLCEMDLTGYRPQSSYPLTQSKKDSFVKRLDIVHKFVKDNYEMMKKAIDRIKVSDLYDEFIEYCQNMDTKFKIKTKIDFNTSLKHIGIIYFKSNGANYYNSTLSESLSISVKHH